MNDYVVVQGVTGSMAAFQDAVLVYLDQGYTPVGGVTISGTDIFQVVGRGSVSIVGIYPITAVVTGPGGSFRVATNQTQNFHPGFKFKVTGSTGNDGIYTVSPFGSTFATGNTTIPVVETVPNAAVDGNIIGTT